MKDNNTQPEGCDFVKLGWQRSYKLKQDDL